MPAELVFVYGSLRKGASNASRLKGAEWVATAAIRGKLLKIGWFPALVVDPHAKTWVWGDVFRIRGGPNLDAFLEYEGLAAGATDGQECRMAEATVRPTPISGWGWEVQLWEWTGSVENGEMIPSGDWLDVERPKSPPLFTGIAAACALATPPIFAAAAMVGDPFFLRVSTLGGLLAPVAGWFAIYFATRRRERGEFLRLLVLAGLVIEGIPAVIGLISLLFDVLQRLF